MIAVFLKIPWLIPLKTTELNVLILTLAGLKMGTLESSLSVQLQAPIWDRQLIGFLDLFISHFRSQNSLWCFVHLYTLILH